MESCKRRALSATEGRFISALCFCVGFFVVAARFLTARVGAFEARFFVVFFALRALVVRFFVAAFFVPTRLEVVTFLVAITYSIQSASRHDIYACR